MPSSQRALALALGEQRVKDSIIQEKLENAVLQLKELREREKEAEIAKCELAYINGKLQEELRAAQVN